MTNSNDPAYPTKFPALRKKENGELVDDWHHIPGLTKREYFAALAMQGSLTHAWSSSQELSEVSIKCADALIAELNKEAEQ